MGISGAEIQRQNNKKKSAQPPSKQPPKKPFKQRYKEAAAANQPVCVNCGYQGKPKLYTKGSIFIEIIAWLMFLLPGVIYSLWRHASRYKGCPQCSAQNMVPSSSPVGRKLLNG
jgi:hypothetical protein